MGGQNRKRGNKEAQHAVRQAGLRMLSSKKYTQAQIAEALGVAHGTVRGWSSKKKVQPEALKKQGKRGRPKGDGKALTPAQERKIIAIIRDKNPKQMHLEFYLWSVGAVISLIEKKFDVTLSDSGMRKYLKRWGFTIQRPATRYSRRDDLVVQRWLVEAYPKIAAEAKTEGAEIHWLDETGVNNQAVYQRGFAPKGKTPVTVKPSKRERISLISTVTNLGTMRFRCFEGALTALLLIAFLESLIAGSSRKLYVIMDNLPVHKGKLVTAWIAANADRIKVFYLPPYAPDVNPDEYLNNDLKQNVHRRSGLPQNKTRLKSNVIAYLRHIQKSPAKVKSYFQAPETQYAA
jgi:transposase